MEDIYEFIQSTFDEYDTERFCRLCDSEDPDKTYNRAYFLMFQRQRLEALSPEKLNFARMLMHMIKGNYINLMDKEDMIKWEGSGFYIDAYGSIVIFHER